jgi:hypothetical protein
MQGEPEQRTRHEGGRAAACEGVLIALKVTGLLAAYVIFVWLVITHLERRYPAPVAEAAALERSAKKATEIPGVVVIRAVPLLRANANTAPADADASR